MHFLFLRASRPLTTDSILCRVKRAGLAWLQLCRNEMHSVLALGTELEKIAALYNMLRMQFVVRCLPKLHRRKFCQTLI